MLYAWSRYSGLPGVSFGFVKTVAFALHILPYDDLNKLFASALNGLLLSLTVRRHYGRLASVRPSSIRSNLRVKNYWA